MEKLCGFFYINNLNYYDAWSYINRDLIAIGGAALIAGTGLSYYLWQVVLRNRRKKIISEAEAEAEVIKKEKILQAKERFLQLKAEHEKVINEKNNRINQAENRIKQKELALSQKLEETQRRKMRLMPSGRV